MKRATSLSEELLGWYALHGRHHLPWRVDRAPYRVVVSEFMLQQTQVDRVVPIFEAFVARWPTFAALAAASQADVVRAWRGLGYNSRAVRLHTLARTVVANFGGALPRDETSLRELPGVGPYTSRAIAAFAYDAPVIALDTNIARIVHRVFLGIEWPPRAKPTELDALGAAFVPAARGFETNSALMDLGATICLARAPKCLVCPLRASCAAAPIDAAGLAVLVRKHAARRSPQERLAFQQTTRYVRGRIVDVLRALPPDRQISLLALHATLAPALAPAHRDAAAFTRIVDSLERDGLIARTPTGYALTAD